MARLEALTAGARVRGLAPHGIATVKHVEWFGEPCVQVLYLDDRGAAQQAISPGSITEQWQDELHDKFGLDFDLLTRDMIEASRTANPFEQKNLLVARLDPGLCTNLTGPPDRGFLP
jgi:hypothetical protein